MQNRFVRAVTVLAGGTAIGQVLMIAVLPLLTRLYTPEEFSVLAVYSGLVMIIAPAACLRLDIAIPMPERDEDAANLLVLALFFAVMLSGILALLIFTMPADLVSLLRVPQLEPFLWMLPLGVLLIASSSALQFWSARKHRFTLIAKAKVTQASAGAGVMIGMGIFGATSSGLMFGQLINSGMAIVSLGRSAIAEKQEVINAVNVAEMRRLFRSHDRFVKYSTFETLANNAAIQVPVVMIAALVGGPEAGFLALAMRIMQAPLGLIGSSIAQVYVSRAPEAHRSGTLGILTANILGGLMRTGVGPLIFAGIIAPDAFSMIFGDEWRRAGVLVGWMTPWFVFQFLVSPVSMALHVTNSQKIALALQLTGLVIRVAAIVAATVTGGGFFSEAYAVSGFVFYAIYLAVVLSVISLKASELLEQFQRSLPFMLGWPVMGILCSYLVRQINDWAW